MTERTGNVEHIHADCRTAVAQLLETHFRALSAEAADRASRYRRDPRRQGNADVNQRDAAFYARAAVQVRKWGEGR